MPEEDLTIRDDARRSQITLERNQAGDVIAIHVVFEDPRPITDFVRYDAAFNSFPRAITSTGEGPGNPGAATHHRRPCDERR